VFTEAFVAYLEQRQMAPFFRENRVADGILAATELIVARAEDAAAGRAFAPPRAARITRGGGATGPSTGAGTRPQHLSLQRKAVGNVRRHLRSG
jgi:hypothetical protein